MSQSSQDLSEISKQDLLKFPAQNSSDDNSEGSDANYI